MDIVKGAVIRQWEVLSDPYVDKGKRWVRCRCLCGRSERPVVVSHLKLALASMCLKCSVEKFKRRQCVRKTDRSIPYRVAR